MASDTPVTGDAGRRPDRLGAALAAGFIVLLLATELVLTLPDVADSASSVANFYAAHRSFIVILQALGLVAAGLFGAYVPVTRGRGLAVELVVEQGKYPAHHRAQVTIVGLRPLQQRRGDRGQHRRGCRRRD